MKYITLIILLLFTTIAYADFHPTDKRALDFSSGGSLNNLHWNVTVIQPVKFADGYVGVQWLHYRDDGEKSNEHIKARAEGGHRFGFVSLRGYGRYGRQSVMQQDSLWHGGGYIDVHATDNISVGVGTWAEQETLLEAFGVDLETGEQGVDFGFRGHVSIETKHISIVGEYLPTHDWQNFTIRVPVSVEIPITKIAFVEQISLVLTATAEYYSETKHVDIENVQYNWTHALRWRF